MGFEIERNIGNSKLMKNVFLTQKYFNNVHVIYDIKEIFLRGKYYPRNFPNHKME